MPGEYAARRRDSNFEMVSSIDVRSYNHGSDASDLFRQTMCSARFMRVQAYALRTLRSLGGLKIPYYGYRTTLLIGSKAKASPPNTGNQEKY
ncbi:hypothetical protein Tco_1243364 [Tanacetum coccineum]